MQTSDNKGFPSFREFIDSVAKAKHSDYLARPAVATTDEDAFAEMKDHILRMAQGVEVSHSFVDNNGQIFDCVPVEQQPSLRKGSKSPATPADIASVNTGQTSPTQIPIRPQLQLERNDKFGNAMKCPDGTIPVRRVTLEELSRYRSLRDFFRKTPAGKGRHPRLSPPEAASGVHKYAHAFQQVTNLGGHSFVNIWDPGVGSQVFSLAQHWYAGGNPVQTVECGWQVYPQHYQTTKPVLFIYWTADAYSQTGCYNLECSAFVQTNSNWLLGGELNTISTDGGTQYELEIAWSLLNGNWWLYLNGTSANEAVGYYPASLYGSGQLSTSATDIDYGGETVNQTAWPPMGSGDLANSGYLHAAYQRDIFFYRADGSGQPAELTPSQPSPNCYTIDLATKAAPWNVCFFFGGPGGGNCS